MKMNELQSQATMLNLKNIMSSETSQIFFKMHETYLNVKI